jgi:acyl-CoA hydrolase
VEVHVTEPTEGVDADATRCEMTWIVMPSQANALGTVFGGQVMAWIDVCAAVSAQRLARADVVTVAMDELTFAAPIQQGEIVVLQSMVNWVGRTSMEVGVRVESEDPRSGARVHTSTAYLTFVAVGADKRRLTLPRLACTSEVHRRRWADAEARRARRLAGRAGRGTP